MKILRIDAANDLRFGFHNLRLSVCAFSVSEKGGIGKGDISVLGTPVLAEADIGTDILRFALCDTAVDCDIELRAGLVTVDALFLEVDIDIQVTQETDILEAVDGIAGEAADGFGQDEIDRPALTGSDHAVELIPLFDACPRNALVGIDAREPPVWSGVDGFGIVPHLCFVAVQLFLLLGGDAAVGNHAELLCRGSQSVHCVRFGGGDFPHNPLWDSVCHTKPSFVTSCPVCNRMDTAPSRRRTL